MIINIFPNAFLINKWISNTYLLIIIISPFFFISSFSNNLNCSRRNHLETYLNKFLPNVKRISPEGNNNQYIDQNLDATDAIEEIFPEFLSDIRFNNATLSPGYQTESYKRLIQKIKQQNETINIIGIGGSITRGKCMNLTLTLIVDEGYTIQPNSTHHARIKKPWFSYLETFFQSIYKINTTAHDFSESGVGTNVHINRIARFKTDATNAINSADIVIIETAVNDLFLDGRLNRYGSKEAITDVIVEENEIFIRQLLRLPNSPMIIYFDASSTSYQSSPAVASHQKIARLYGIPQIDMMTLFNPGDNKQQQQWIKSVYRGRLDQVHLSSFGHKLSAIALLTLINGLLCNSSNNNNEKLLFNQSSSLITINDNPIFVNKEYSLMYEKGYPVYLSASEMIKEPYYYSKNNFNVITERQDREVMFATEIGSSFVISLPESQIKENLIFGIFLIEYLTSYNHMGAIDVYAYNYKPIDISSKNNNIMKCNEIFVQNKELTKIRIDSLHKQKVSVMSTSQFHINRNSTINDLYLCFEIIKTEQERKENKICIKSITFF